MLAVVLMFSVFSISGTAFAAQTLNVRIEVEAKSSYQLNEIAIKCLSNDYLKRVVVEYYCVNTRTLKGKWQKLSNVKRMAKKFILAKDFYYTADGCSFCYRVYAYDRDNKLINKKPTYCYVKHRMSEIKNVPVKVGNTKKAVIRNNQKHTLKVNFIDKKDYGYEMPIRVEYVLRTGEKAKNVSVVSEKYNDPSRYYFVINNKLITKGAKFNNIRYRTYYKVPVVKYNNQTKKYCVVYDYVYSPWKTITST